MKEKIRKIWSVKWIRWTLFGVALVCVLFLRNENNTVALETVAVARGSVVESVAASGQVRPKQYASLRFKTVGTVARFFADVGGSVSSGETLAVLDTSELVKKRTQADADLVAANVALLNAKQDIADQRVKNEQSLALLYAELPTTIADVLNLTQQVYASFVTFYDANGRLSSAVANPILNNQLVVDANNAYGAAEVAAALIHREIEDLPVSAVSATLERALLATHSPLQNLQKSLTALINAVAGIPTGSVSAATLDAYKTTLSTARTNINSALNKEIVASTDIHDARVQNELLLNSKLAAERTATANVEKAQAALDIAEQGIADAYIRAPFSGLVAARSKQIGELVTTSDQVFYLIGSGGLEVIANVPEIDIAKIAVGDPAKFELDAYGAENLLDGTVTEIDPAETIVDGVATYRVTFAFAKADERIRSGMTVNLSIQTDRRDGVIVVPQRALRGKNGQRSVQIASSNPDLPPVERTVVVGLRGSDGVVEILEGLAEGERVILGAQ